MKIDVTNSYESWEEVGLADPFNSLESLKSVYNQNFSVGSVFPRIKYSDVIMDPIRADIANPALAK
jgi:hypothetical protein